VASVPISAKLVLATSIVVAAAVGTATWFSHASIRALTEQQVAARRSAGEQAIVRQSDLDRDGRRRPARARGRDPR
jgi:hypothetical protein